jgi:hypothetical protein
MSLHLDIPDHTTLSRRSKTLNIKLKAKLPPDPIDLIIDSTGLSVFGEGQWAAAKHGERGSQGWKKLHLGVDGHGAIVAEALTDPNVDDAKTGVGMIKKARFKWKTIDDKPRGIAPPSSSILKRLSPDSTAFASTSYPTTVFIVLLDRTGSGETALLRERQEEQRAEFIDPSRPEWEKSARVPVVRGTLMGAHPL